MQIATKSIMQPKKRGSGLLGSDMDIIDKTKWDCDCIYTARIVPHREKYNDLGN